MFAISFDPLWNETKRTHPKGVLQAYAEIGAVLNRHGFGRIQGSVYVSRNGGLIGVTTAMTALRALSWFPVCVRDIRAFKVEDWSDFADFIKS